MPTLLISILAVISLIWSAVLTILFLQLKKHYNRFTADTEKKDLVSVLNQLLKQSLKNQKDIEVANKRIDSEIKRGQTNFKKFSLKRFNPFTNTGGDQSFVLCLLDENNNGFVISSLHSRENTRIYAKRIEKGESADQVLSEEERVALTTAQK